MTYPGYGAVISTKLRGSSKNGASGGGGVFSHWGVYVGAGWVIGLESDGRLHKDRIEERFPKWKLEMKGGYDTGKKAEEMFSEGRTIGYDVLDLNCQDFCKKCAGIVDNLKNAVSKSCYHPGVLDGARTTAVIATYASNHVLISQRNHKLFERKD